MPIFYGDEHRPFTSKIHLVSQDVLSISGFDISAFTSENSANAGFYIPPPGSVFIPSMISKFLVWDARSVNASPVTVRERTIIIWNDGTVRNHLQTSTQVIGGSSNIYWSDAIKSTPSTGQGMYVYEEGGTITPLDPSTLFNTKPIKYVSFNAWILSGGAQPAGSINSAYTILGFEMPSNG